MNVEIVTEAPIFLFWEYLFQIFGILSLQCSNCADGTVLKKLYWHVPCWWYTCFPGTSTDGTSVSQELHWWYSCFPGTSTDGTAVSQEPPPMVQLFPSNLHWWYNCFPGTSTDVTTVSQKPPLMVQPVPSVLAILCCRYSGYRGLALIVQLYGWYSYIPSLGTCTDGSHELPIMMVVMLCAIMTSLSA